MKNKIILNTFLILSLVAFSILFISEYNSETKTTVTVSKNTPSVSSFQIKEQMHERTIPLNKQLYLDEVNYFSAVFTDILKTYELNTILTKKEDSNFSVYETSILMENLNLPNGYKTTNLNFENNETMKTYISLLDTLKNKSWNRMLNINISSTSSILEFNETNYPEVFNLLTTLNPDINLETLSSYVNDRINDKTEDIYNEFYNINKIKKENLVLIQISIYLNNGEISED